MEAVHRLLKITVPNYFRSLPIPKSIDGFAKLTASDWIILLLFIYLILLIIVAVVKLLLPKSPPFVNQSVKKKEPKIVDFVDIEDLDKEKISYCRCWRSKKFPLCDGSHNEHNKATGDNVGPLVLKHRDK